MRYHFVVNPVAGRGTAVTLMRGVAEALRTAGMEVSSHVTTASGDAGRHVADLGEDATDRLIAVGGDGTLREVINGRRPMPWPVGVIPMGTANLVGREVRMPLNRRVQTIAQCLLRAQPWSVDLITMRAIGATGDREQVALANVGAGLDGELVHAISNVRSAGDGFGGYARWIGPMWDCLRSFSFPRLRVTVDGLRTYAAAACVVQNAHNYGGVFELAPGAALDSGRLDVMLIRARTNRDLFRILVSSLARRTTRQKDVKFLTARHVRIESSDHVRLQADGDPAGRTDVELEILPQSLELLRA
jgi:diacylglycerol kinase (ATP)